MPRTSASPWPDPASARRQRRNRRLSGCRSDAVSAAPVGSGFSCTVFLPARRSRINRSARTIEAPLTRYGPRSVTSVPPDTSSNVAASVISPNKAGSVVTKLMASMILQALGRKRHLPGFSAGIGNTSLLFRVGKEIRGIHWTGEGWRGEPRSCLAASPSLYLALGRRSVAQPGRALPSGGRGRRFKSSHSDQYFSPPHPHGIGMEELAVVAVIDGKEEAGGARYIEFKVYRSPTDADRALGSWRFPESGRAIDESKLGNTIEADFRFAVDCADQHGIPFVWVNDPDELFPPWTRPR